MMLLVLLALGTAPLGPALQEQAAGDERRIAQHFAVCDLDANGWVSLREATATLGVDKAEFRSFDRDGDGRIDAEEFRARHARMLELLGAVAPVPSTGDEPRAVTRTNAPAQRSAPIPAPAARSYDPAPRGSFPRPADLIAAYDRDGSGALSVDEVAEALRHARALLSAEVILEQTDRDASGELGLGELDPLASMLAGRLPWNERPPAADTERRVESTGPAPSLAPSLAPPLVPDGRAPTDPPPTPPAAQIEPPTEPTPAPLATSLGAAAYSMRASLGHFGRLDADGFGGIDARDLETLLSPARTSVRASAVVSALDRDGDGALSFEEFLFALGGER